MPTLEAKELLIVIDMTAKQLKNRTGDAIRAVLKGQRVLLTHRGRPIAQLVPLDAREEPIPSYEEAWPAIEEALARTRPPLKSWREAMARSRRR